MYKQLYGCQYLTACEGPPPWLVPGSLSDVPGPVKLVKSHKQDKFNHLIIINLKALRKVKAYEQLGQ